ncbi:hypothetical protein YC2023_090292 [Brassica napus]
MVTNTQKSHQTWDWMVSRYAPLWRLDKPHRFLWFNIIKTKFAVTLNLPTKGIIIVVENFALIGYQLPRHNHIPIGPTIPSMPKP